MNRLINYAYIHPSANKFELNYLQVLIFSDFFFESSIDIQSWIISILKYYMFVTSWYLPQCPHNFSYSQNTVLTRFVLRSNQTRPKKTNRIREMSETCNENTINCNPVLHSEDPRSNWFISNIRNGSRTRTRKYLFSRDRIVTTSQGWIIATSLYPRAIGIIFGIVLAIMDEPLASFRILRCCSA